MYNLSTDKRLKFMHKNIQQTLAFDPANDFDSWRGEVDSKFRELLGIMPEKTAPNTVIEYVKDCGDYIDKRFIFTTEEACDVPCHLLIPKTGQAPYPVVICLQGHSTGMHISLGRPKYDGDERSIAGGRDFGLQAVKEGYAALVMEQRCFGERKDARPDDVQGFGSTCHHISMSELMYGRTMPGLRAWDMSRALDVLESDEFPEVDMDRVGCMGNSGGGTATYFTSCIEPRIKVAMPSSSVCSFRDSIGWIDHCQCNYIPGIMRYFEMSDLACLIAPRPLIVVSGVHDPIFPIDSVKANFEEIQKIYAAAGCEDKCRLLVGEKGHQFYPELGWPVFREMVGW